LDVYCRRTNTWKERFILSFDFGIYFKRDYHSDTQEAATCATLWPLWKAKQEDLDLSVFNDTFKSAGPLRHEDILLKEEEVTSFNSALTFTICEIIVTQGGDRFLELQKELEKHRPVVGHKIEKHKTHLHPMTVFDIDESTIVGNGEVAEAIYKEAGVFDTPLFNKLAKILGGDQLSVARLRSLNNIRIGQQCGFAGFSWGAWVPGLFHAKMADVHGNIVTHFGEPNTYNPGSLWHHNTILQRIPIVLSSLPPFNKCRDLYFVSLYARILHCLLLVSKRKTINDYALRVSSFEQSWKDAELIRSSFTDSDKVAESREARLLCGGGDMVFENAILFLRDALVSRMFSSAVKRGESGLIVLILKTWALSFHGNGRTKYAHEMLHIAHNLEHVWPKPVRDIVLNNWLLNPSDKEDRFVEMDRIQEFFNFWIKVRALYYHID
jgi:hypothetical protein